MTMILSFVALRSPPDNPAPASLATSSDFQLQLAEAASGPDQSGRTVAIAKEFVDDERFVGSQGGGSSDYLQERGSSSGQQETGGSDFSEQ